jgi:hypothetical protein
MAKSDNDRGYEIDMSVDAVLAGNSDVPEIAASGGRWSRPTSEAHPLAGMPSSLCSSLLARSCARYKNRIPLL